MWYSKTELFLQVNNSYYLFIILLLAGKTLTTIVMLAISLTVNFQSEVPTAKLKTRFKRREELTYKVERLT